MKNLQRVLEQYKGKKFKVKNEKINQLERNAFKADMVNALGADLAELGLTVGKVDKGFAILVDNDELGALAVVFDGVVKGLDYDFDFEVAEQVRVETERAEKLAKRKAKAQG